MKYKGDILAFIELRFLIAQYFPDKMVTNRNDFLKSLQVYVKLLGRLKLTFLSHSAMRSQCKGIVSR